MTDQIIAAEQIEQAAWSIYCKAHSLPQSLPVDWPSWRDPEKYRDEARAAFRAAGFRVEGGET